MKRKNQICYFFLSLFEWQDSLGKVRLVPRCVSYLINIFPQDNIAGASQVGNKHSCLKKFQTDSTSTSLHVPKHLFPWFCITVCTASLFTDECINGSRGMALCLCFLGLWFIHPSKVPSNAQPSSDKEAYVWIHPYFFLIYWSIGHKAGGILTCCSYFKRHEVYRPTKVRTVQIMIFPETDSRKYCEESKKKNTWMDHQINQPGVFTWGTNGQIQIILLWA